MSTAVDVAVVGGGMAGVSVAAALAVDRSVLLLEAESQLAYHTTGRSAAVFLASYGGPQVRALTRASRPLFDAVPEGDPDAGPLLTPTAELIVADRAGMPALERQLARLPELARLTPEQALAYYPVLDPGYLAGAAVDAHACNIDVMGLHQHYVRAGRRAGMAVRSGAQVLAGTRIGDSWVLDTTAGPVSAGIVVNAAGAWADRLAATLGAKPLGLTPLRRTIAIALARGIEPGWPLVGDAIETFYCRPESGGLLISPADETPSEPVDAVADELDVARALERVNAAITVRLRSVATTWAGLRTFAPDRVPVAGWDTTQPGLFWLAGQGGYGIQLAPALAVLGAALIRGDQVPAGILTHGVDPAELAPARLR